MKILLVSATEKELASFLDWNGVTPYVWHDFENHSVLTAFTGVGVVAAVVAIAELIDKYQPDFVLQAGIGGCYDNSGLAVGDSVLIESERLADLGVFYPDGLRRVFLDDNELSTESLSKADLKRVFGNTVNAASAPYVSRDGVSVESMEGYALFYVCLRRKINFAEIRTISNIVSIDRTSWNLTLATENLSHTVKKICELSSLI